MRVCQKSVGCIQYTCRKIVPYDYPIEKIREKNPEGIIFSGGPASVYGENSPKCDSEVFNLVTNSELINLLK